ncbi:maleylpyruvate isomerase N-terminal domain-containing protein [Ornithinimicrobium pekingense]|uniref:Maleylpyruvate isomerase family mycothiol-dependent enzyme n=1 Tax=Ornithinimicrobium pekingense TaxID=384677 RepID=A0ABQ2F414_9MICO|nr:maleylpyruvate isomerase N-terminal domain-containing protein [Ornithinimicrobium pekingense]GGK59991.1 hypothetical protein GCM10011509_05340 [Ornithinimicrobium pekingense]
MEHRTVEEHVAGIRTAVDAFVRSAAAAGPEAAVPTCPAWTVRRLLAHQGMVHRWARATLRGEECHPPAWNAEGQQVADPVGWLLEGADALVTTIETAPDDVRATVFLADAPPPRVFWARRQCHETTIHAVDALAASLGRLPDPRDAAWVDEPVALDGIDELLTGFVPRGRSRFAGAGPRSLTVRARGSGREWGVEIGADGAVRTTRLRGSDEVVGTSLDGSAVALYLALWNRAAPGAVDDPGDVLAMWRTRARVRWS